jgi:Flp pilus assembly protein TadG
MKVRLRSKSGAFAAEFAAVLVFGLPLLTVLGFVALEAARFYTIKSAMEVAARTAARGLVVQYNTTGTEGASVTGLTVPNFVANSNQFTVTWDTNTPPSFVTVSCSYPTSGQYGLAPFPAGPLRYLSNATFDTSNIAVQGTTTFPIQ